MKYGNTSLWVKRLTARADADALLVCFPYAGAGANVFRRLAQACPPRIAVHAVEYPGRASRLREAPADSVADLVAGAAPALAPLLNQPFAVLGYSFGALVAFEWVKRLEETGGSRPRALFLCARQAPGLPLTQSPLHPLPDDQFIEAVQTRYGGIPPEVLADRDLLEVFLPALRMDIRASETCPYRNGVPLGCPIHVFGGERDSTTSFVGLESWRAETDANFEIKVFPAGHFFLSTHGREVVAAIVGALAAPLPDSAIQP